MPKIDITGQRFGRLVALGEAGKDGKKVRWLCLCDCGNTTSARGTHLRRGTIRSCGCLNDENRPSIRLRHGHARKNATSPEYWTWCHMMRRCYSSTDQDFKAYGARGITVCDRWRTFENFLADMGERPSGKSIDRYPDNDGNYEPGNCRWATPKEQANNRRKQPPSIWFDCWDKL